MALELRVLQPATRVDEPHGFEHCVCVAEIPVPDQLRAAVTGPGRCDPEINPAYLETAEHYGVAVIPARPGTPRDKAKVESGRARRLALDPCGASKRETFFSLGELNQAIRELLKRLNTRPFQKLGGCRRLRRRERTKSSDQRSFCSLGLMT